VAVDFGHLAVPCWGAPWTNCAASYSHPSDLATGETSPASPRGVAGALLAGCEPEGRCGLETVVRGVGGDLAPEGLPQMPGKKGFMAGRHLRLPVGGGLWNRGEGAWASWRVRGLGAEQRGCGERRPEGRQLALE